MISHNYYFIRSCRSETELCASYSTQHWGLQEALNKRCWWPFDIETFSMWQALLGNIHLGVDLKICLKDLSSKEYLLLSYCCMKNYCQTQWIKITTPGGSDGKEFAHSAGDPGLNPGWGRSPGEGNGYPFLLEFLPAESHVQRLQSMGSQRAGLDWPMNTSFSWLVDLLHGVLMEATQSLPGY